MAWRSPSRRALEAELRAIALDLNLRFWLGATPRYVAREKRIMQVETWKFYNRTGMVKMCYGIEAAVRWLRAQGNKAFEARHQKGFDV